jgi:PA14 domain
VNHALKRWARRYRVELLLFALLWITDAYFYQSTQHNEAVRFDQLRAIVQDHRLEIDRYWWNSADEIHYHNKGTTHVYPNKAPGMTLLALVPFGILSHFLTGLGNLGPPPWAYWHVLVYLTTLFTVSLLSALAAVAMYRILRGLGGGGYFSILAVLAIWLGTLALPYSTLFFSHQFAAGLLTIAFYLLFRIGRGEITGERRQAFYLFGAGLLMSFSVATEYPTLLLAGALFLYGIWAIRRCRKSLSGEAALAGIWGLGLLIGAGALIWYNLAAFDKAFYIPYEAYARPGANFSSVYEQGWFGLHWLGFRHFEHALASITVDSRIGMLYLGFNGWRVYACSPVLWFVVPGLVMMIWRKDLRPEGLVVAAMTVMYILFVTSYGNSIYDWSGASYVGSRHLVPLLPFLTLPLFFGARRLRFAFYPLLAVSIFYMLILTATEPRVAIPYENPARDLLIPDYLRARFAQNTEALFGGQRNLARDSAAFNLGELAGLPSHYQLIPLLAWWLVAGGTLLTIAAKPNETTSQDESAMPGKEDERASPKLALAGLVLFAAAVGLPPIIHHAVVTSRHPRHGLLGKYYRNVDWNGQPIDVQVDKEVNFDWTRSLPLPAPFSVEWTGSIAIERQGIYRFGLVADDGATLEIDNRIVVDASRGPILQERRGMIALSPGLHPIRIRYFNIFFGGLAKLSWAAPGRPEEIVPAEVLIPPSTPAPAPSR